MPRFETYVKGILPAGRENPALNFLLERYMGPFARGAAEAMLKELSVRCGLRWESAAAEFLCEECGDFPYWIRMAASFFHRRLDVEKRPLSISLESARVVFGEFLRLEGAPLARVALGDLHLKFPELALPETFVAERKASAEQSRILEAYGLLGGSQEVKRGMVAAGLRLLAQSPAEETEIGLVEEIGGGPEKHKASGLFTSSEWAEELSIINRRRNLLEADLRSAIRMALRLNGKGSWQVQVLGALASERREKLTSLAGSDLMDQLYWQELGTIVVKKWDVLGTIFNDRKRFEEAMGIVNARPDAHARKLDAAEIALHRRELDWLEQCLR